MYQSKAAICFLIALVAYLSLAAATAPDILPEEQRRDFLGGLLGDSSTAAAAASTGSGAAPSTTTASTVTTSSTSSAAAISSTTLRPTTSSAQTSTSPHTTTAPSTTPSPSSVVERHTTTLTIVVAGSTVQSVQVQSTTVSASAAATGLNSGDSSGKSASTSSTPIIIGCVAGIGGAALLGGLAYVAWRIWGNRKSTLDEDDDLMGTSAHGHKVTDSADNSPFKSTLDQYHNPAGRVNAAANF